MGEEMKIDRFQLLARRVPDVKMSTFVHDFRNQIQSGFGVVI